MKESSIAERIVATALAGLLVSAVVSSIIMYREVGVIQATMINIGDDIGDLQRAFRDHDHQ